MSDDDNDPPFPFPRCHQYAHSPACRCCTDHRQSIRQLLAELAAMRSTAAKSMAMVTERVISDAMVLNPSSSLSCPEHLEPSDHRSPSPSPEEDVISRSTTDSFSLSKLILDQLLTAQMDSKNMSFVKGSVIDVSKIVQD